MKAGWMRVALLVATVWDLPSSARLPNGPELPSPATQSKMWNQGSDRSKPTITLRVYDFGAVDPTMLAGARMVASEIFLRAGVEAVWLDCHVRDNDCGKEAELPQFRLRIVPAAVAGSLVADDSLGFAIPCGQAERACLFYISYPRICELATKHGVGIGRILGHVMAHEIGHALLGLNAHELYGIMQARLPVHDVERTLYFTSAQSKRLQAELLTRKRATDRQGVGESHNDADHQ